MKSGMKALMVVGVVVVAALIIGGMYISWKNQLVRYDENCKQAWAQVESQMQRRLDLIPNLVETVKGYAAHESDVFIQVTQARASVAGAATPEAKIAADNQLTSALSRLMVVVENYPDLKANTNFLALQDELAGTENRISVERRRYNEAAQLFNTKIRTFPLSLAAKGYKAAPYFQAVEAAREAPKVKF
jgi:LemA protein